MRTHFTLAETWATIAAARSRAEGAGDETVATLDSSLSRAREGAMSSLGGFDHETATAAFAGITPTGASVPDW